MPNFKQSKTDTCQNKLLLCNVVNILNFSYELNQNFWVMCYEIMRSYSKVCLNKYSVSQTF